MLKKTVPLALLLLIGSAAAEAQVAIRVGPPAPIVERYGPPPRPGYVWQSGYHRWNGRRYVWTTGHWGRPPRPGATWVPGAYDHRGDAYYFHRGYWR
jgi:hypothetical protein